MSFLSQPLQNILIRPKRMIGDIAVQVVVNEQTTDTLTITKQPVQQGASVTDHAYMEPTQFSHTIYFAAAGFENVLSGGNGLAQVYQQLLSLQSSATPFDIVTPKRIYHNMLVTALAMTTDKNTENCLAIHASYQQVIFVPILATTVQLAKLKSRANAPTQNTGQKSSALKTIAGIPALLRGG